MKRSAIIAAILATGLLTAAGAWAQGPADRGERAPLKEQPKDQPKEQPKTLIRQEEAVSLVQRASPGGRMNGSIRTETQSNGQVVYRVPWVTAPPDNRRVDFVVDAQTGRILSGR